MQNVNLNNPPAPKVYSLIWDECALIDSKAQDLLGANVAETENEAREMAIHDHEFLEWEFDDFLEDFGAILRRISNRGQYFIEGKNMGWRQLSGWMIVDADNAHDFIAKAFPKTSEWTLRGQFDRKHRVLSYTLSHHDAPTGEYYSVRACNAGDRKRH